MEAAFNTYLHAADLDHDDWKHPGDLRPPAACPGAVAKKKVMVDHEWMQNAWNTCCFFSTSLMRLKWKAIVAEVLPTSKFLKNVGLESAAPKWSAKSAVSACAQELETEVESEKQGSASLKEKFNVQQYELEVLNLKFGESEQARKKQLGEIEELKNQGDETNTLLRCLLCLDKE
ncbi:hypothetical protein C2845_PM08G15220 [Panicum miliaceum]|uniref:Uncharacterized protein n=1 Tax=Panicum miliaceum TaxID=4540 RepID=A0A3L6R500_PANMI|nr:hypothetical protein C2845_PM08G15220 [Panicum miliaceum]